MVKKQKPEIFRARQTATTWFSKYIRARDCVEVMGGLEYGKCFTCDAVLPFSKLQCGHFMPGRKDSGLFDERNAAAQCYQCNVRKQGRWPEFERELIKKYGQRIVERVKANYFEDIKFEANDYRNIATAYRQKYQAIVRAVKENRKDEETI